VIETTTIKGSGFAAGLKAMSRSVFSYVLVGTYISIGALAHDFGFSAPWAVLSTVLMWAGPAQVIIITMLGAGAPAFEVALAIGLSGIRLLPMVVAMLPVLKTPATRHRDLLLPAHFTAASMWVEVLRLAPNIPREARIGFANGIGGGFMAVAVVFCIVGHYLASSLPALLVAGLLFLTPMSFLISVIQNARLLSDGLALVFGLVLAPLLAIYNVNLDLLWTGLVGGAAAYAIHRLREAMR
jgi:predicted branched-subunit amino acid permease